MGDTLKFTGLLKIREIPAEWDDATYKFWWCDEYTESGVWVRKARMSESEKERMTVWEGHNLIMTAGITRILTFIGNSANNTVAFAQYYAVGTGAIYQVNASDNSLSTELFRKATTGNTVSGSGVTINTSFLASEGNGTYSNIGLFGNGATSTPGSGTLHAHLLSSYPKSSIATSNDYLISAQ